MVFFLDSLRIFERTNAARPAANGVAKEVPEMRLVDVFDSEAVPVNKLSPGAKRLTLSLRVLKTERPLLGFTLATLIAFSHAAGYSYMRQLQLPVDAKTRMFFMAARAMESSRVTSNSFVPRLMLIISTSRAMASLIALTR